jgi:hypothetical protein
MRIGLTYPQAEFSPDVDVVRTYARTVEDLGYEHIANYLHAPAWT